MRSMRPGFGKDMVATGAIVVAIWCEVAVKRRVFWMDLDRRT